MNTDITASAKPEYPVIDRNPPFTKVVGNFSTLDYLRLTTITGVSVTVGYLSGIRRILLSYCVHISITHCFFLSFLRLLCSSIYASWTWSFLVVKVRSFFFFVFLCFLGIKPGIRGPSMVTGGLIGLMGGFMYAYQNSAGRLMGFFPNDGEVAKYKKLL